jgi:tRNA(Arg) A34 adenosine deaminase TadA/predicted enzyme related to lactoylglutathione lyase
VAQIQDNQVRQLRLVVEVEDFDQALHFYRDDLGLDEQLAFAGDGDARVAILGAGTATLELANPAQRQMVDAIEVGRVLEPAVRVAFEVADARAAAAALTSAGATALAPPTETPWRSLNARLVAPDGLQVTLFQELDTPEQRAGRPGFGTAGATAELTGTDVVWGPLLSEAVRLATVNADDGQLPFAALVVRAGQVVATGVNTSLQTGDPTAHAEIEAVRNACRVLATPDLSGAIVVSSCEPCALCHAACATAGIERIVYAAPKEMLPELGGTVPPLLPRMQAALRRLAPQQIVHVPTPTAGEPFDRYITATRTEP